MIASKIQTMIGEALKAGDEIRLSTLRMLGSAFNYEKIAKQHELTEAEELEVIKSEAKKRKDAIEAYKSAGASDRAEKEEKELKVLEEFLPAQMSDEELRKIVDEVIMGLPAEARAQAGKVIGMVMGKTKGQADGGRVSLMVKEKLG